jgi:WD40 repeat protein
VVPRVHGGPVRSVAFSPDGKTVLTGGNDGDAQLWEVATQQPLGAPLRHKNRVSHVAFRPDDGNIAVIGDEGGHVRLWDLRISQAIGEPFRCQSPYQCNRRSHLIACADDGRSILTSGWRRSEREHGAQFSDATNGQPIGPPLLHESAIRGVALSRKGNVAITGSDDGTARLWDARTRKPLCPPLRHQGQVLAVALNAEGTLALTGSVDKTARLWKVPSGEPVGDVFRHPGQVWAVAFRPDGQAVLTGCDDGSARLWTLAPAEPTGTPTPDPELKGLRHLAPFPDGKTVLRGQSNGIALVCDAATMKPIDVRPLVNEYAVLSVAVSPDGTMLLTGCVDGTVRVWSSKTRERIGRPMLHKGPVHSVAFSPDGRTVLTGSGDRTARVWDAATGKPIGPPLNHDAALDVADFEPSGKAVLTCTEEGWRRWELAPEATGPDERFVLWAQVATGSEIDTDGTFSSLDAAAWNQQKERLRALGGAPGP